MSNKTVSFCKYIHWKWSKEDKSQLIKSTRKKNIDLSATTDKIYKEEENKREVCNNRISQRDPMIQTNINPYMVKSDYLTDLGVQDNYLRPQDSNF